MVSIRLSLSFSSNSSASAVILDSPPRPLFVARVFLYKENSNI
jgi:hypothetical protein